MENISTEINQFETIHLSTKLKGIRIESSTANLEGCRKKLAILGANKYEGYVEEYLRK